MGKWKQPGDPSKEVEVFGGNYKIDGDLEITGDLTASVADNSTDVVRVTNTNVANTDTDTFVFSFTPSVIVLEWHGYAEHDTSNEAGISHGSCVVTITGTDTATSTMTGVHFNDNNSASRWEVTTADTTNVSIVRAGSDASDQGTITSARTSWTTSSNTLTITHTVANTADANTTITYTATAFK